MPGGIEREGENRELPVDLFQGFLDNQAKELEIRAREQDLTEQQDSHNFELSKISIKAQLENMERNRVHDRQMQATRMKFSALLAVLFTLITSLALWLDKEQFVLEVLRVAFYGGFGAVAGTYYQKSKQASSRDDSED